MSSNGPLEENTVKRLLNPVFALSGLALFGLTMIVPTNSASAAMVSPVPAYSHIQGSGVQLPVELVGRRHRYHRHRHGHRYRHRRHGYGHYYRGYWYAVPWWLGAAAVTAPYYAPPRYGRDAHVEWCLNRYRSYNVRTDTFRGYDGYDHPCISPYR